MSGGLMETKNGYVHITKDGEWIPLANIETRHLINIINWVKRKAKGGGGEIIGFDADDRDYIEYSEEDIEEIMGLEVYQKELDRRISENWENLYPNKWY